MNETDDYTHVQRRLCAVIAKSEWTSSRMRMQKSGEELRERRTKSHQTANKFLQDLLEKRTDGDLIDDNGAVDRYNKFVKYKSASNDDGNSSLDEFDRRLRALNNDRRKQAAKLNNQNLNTIVEKSQQQQFKNDLQAAIEVQNDKRDVTQQLHNEERSKPSRKLPSIASIPITSTPNDTTNDLTTPLFHDDEIDELSNVQSADISFVDSQANHIESPISQHQSSSVEKTETLNSSTSSLNHALLTQTLYAPKPHRPDGTEIIVSSSSPRSPSNVLPFSHCYFPRSLTSRGKLNSTSLLKRQLPSLPMAQSLEQKQVQHEQFDKTQLYDLLDHLDNNLNQYSPIDFTKMLDQLTVSTVIDNHQDEITHNLSTANYDYQEEENILPNLFDQSTSSTQEKLFYTTFSLNIDDPKNLFFYTMTLSTVQLSASILLPYSILNGRRPSLKSSHQTHFKQIHSKQQGFTYQVTAIESSLNSKQLQQNDIILKINDQSVWGLTTDAVIHMFKHHSQKSNSCSLTIARLCQPFV